MLGAASLAPFETYVAPASSSGGANTSSLAAASSTVTIAPASSARPALALGDGGFPLAPAQGGLGGVVPVSGARIQGGSAGSPAQIPDPTQAGNASQSSTSVDPRISIFANDQCPGTSWTATSARNADSGQNYDNCHPAANNSEHPLFLLNLASPTIGTTPSPATEQLTTTAGGLSDVANLSGGSSPTGSITFDLYLGTGCTGTPVYTNTVSVTGNGLYSSGSYIPSGTGTYEWTASYSGDINNNGVSPACGSEPVPVTSASPTVVTNPMPPSETLTTTAGALSDTATLSGGFSPTGSITFDLYSGIGCAATPVYAETLSVSSGNGLYSSGWYTPTGVGPYNWTTLYSGDPNNNGVFTLCGDEPVTVSPASPSVSTSVSPASETLPTVTGVADTATLSGGFSPTGSITFDVYSNSGCTDLVFGPDEVTVSSGNAAYISGAFTPTGAGTYYWTAAYAGDTNNNPFTTACGATGETLTVSPASPSATTLVSPSTIVVGSSASDTATLSGGYSPYGGTITFFAYSDSGCTDLVFTSSAIGVSGGTATSDWFTPTGVGTYYWTADFTGDANNNPFTTPCDASGETLVVSAATPSTTTTSVSPSTMVIGSLASDTATLSGGYSPYGGTITFYAYSDRGCTELVFTSSAISVSGGMATSNSFTPTGAGTYYWTAAYSGDAGNNPFTTACGATGETLTVNPASPSITTLVSSASETLPTLTGVTDSATLSGGHSPTGTITWNVYFDDGTCTSSPVFTSSAVTVTGNGAYTSTPSFTPASGAGDYYWTASYTGDGNNDAFTTACGASGETLIVNPASPSATTSVSPSTIVVGSSASDTATLSGGYSPYGGTITFYTYSDTGCTELAFASSATSVSSGTATSNSFTPTGVGTYYWTAAYTGDANNIPITTPCDASGETLTVTAATPSTTTTSVSPSTIVVGLSASDTATLSGGHSPYGGTITFYAYSDRSCTAVVFTSSAIGVSGGTATSNSFTPTGVGTYYWTAAYTGDANNNPFTTPCDASGETLTVTAATPSTTTTSVTPSTIAIGSSANDTATLSGGYSPYSGTVTFYAYSDRGCTDLVFTSSAIGVSGGRATSNPFTPTGVGTYYWTAAYTGDANNNAFTTACGATGETLTVYPTSLYVTTLVSSASETLPTLTGVTDTGTLSGGHSPTGTISWNVYFDDGACTSIPVFTSSAATVTGNGAYTSTPSFTPASGAGDYYWTASYTGDGNNAAFTTACGASGETLTVNPASPSVTTLVSFSTIVVGSSASDTATLSGGYSPYGGTITFYAYLNDDACTSSPVFTSSAIGVSGGTATSNSFTPADVGTYYWTAAYTGDTNNSPSISACGAPGETLSVNPASPSATTLVSPSRIVVGSSASDTATLSGGYSPYGGTITFYAYLNDDACTSSPVFTSSAIGVSGGTATSNSFTPADVGTYYWTAAYTGDTNNSPSISACGAPGETLSVNPASPSATTLVSPSRIVVGSSASDTATLSGGYSPNGGTITFYAHLNDDACTSSPVFTSSAIGVSGGTATSNSFTPTGAGSYYWTANYSGDSNNLGFVTACDANGETLTVTTPAITLTPTRGPSGISVLVSGTGYTPGATITTTINNGAMIGTCGATVSADGTFSCAVTITGPASGTPFTVRATGSDGSFDSATAPFTITSTPPSTYTVTFTETGMRPAAGGGVAFNGGPSTPFGGRGIEVVSSLANGTYDYTIAAGTGYELLSSTPSSPVTVNGTDVRVTVTFVELFSVTFTETGMPPGAGGGVAFNGGSTTPFGGGDNLIFGGLVNSSYAYTVSAGTGYQVVSATPSSPVTVSGSNGTVTVTFEAIFGVTFIETGLPNGTAWSVTFDGSTRAASAPSSIAFVGVLNGTHTYSVADVSGYTSTPTTGAPTTTTVKGAPVTVGITFVAASPSSGTPPPFVYAIIGILVGGALILLALALMRRRYTVTFVATGMPMEVGGGIAFDGKNERSFGTGGTVTFRRPNGSYTYAATAGAGYRLVSSTPPSPIRVHRADVRVTVVFAPD